MVTTKLKAMNLSEPTIESLHTTHRSFFHWQRVDASITILHFTSVIPSTPQVHEFAAMLDEFLRTNHGALIINVSKGKFLDLEKRRIIHSVLKKTTRRIKTHFVCLAFLNASLISSLVLQRTLFSSACPIPVKNFYTEEDAVAWCQKLIPLSDR